MHHNFRIEKPILAVPHGCCVHGADPCCACVCSTDVYIVNINLTTITPPPPTLYLLKLLVNKSVLLFYAVLSLCSREFRLVRRVSPRATFCEN